MGPPAQTSNNNAHANLMAQIRQTNTENILKKPKLPSVKSASGGAADFLSELKNKITPVKTEGSNGVGRVIGKNESSSPQRIQNGHDPPKQNWKQVSPPSGTK